MTAGHEGYIKAALEEARIGLAEKNLPVGSVLVLGGEIVGRGRNIVQSRHDVTAHAEVVAIREACAKI
jgi:tRNA(adenine34) deaminase